MVRSSTHRGAWLHVIQSGSSTCIWPEFANKNGKLFCSVLKKKAIIMFIYFSPVLFQNQGKPVGWILCLQIPLKVSLLTHCNCTLPLCVV